MSSLPQLLQEDLEALAAAGDALTNLDAARRLREHAEELEIELVAAARAAGASWTQIGRHYGMSKQGAQQRFRKPRRPSKHQPKSS
ncbi:MAG: hypothetical protein ABI746_05095 [Dermatophilaceae bacterium]